MNRLLSWFGYGVLTFFFLPQLSNLADAGEKKQSVSGKEGAVRSQDITGALLQRQPGQPWRAVAEKTAIPAGTELIALPLTVLHSANDAVELRLVADIGQRGPFPVLETGVQVNPPGAKDVDVTPQRGILVLSNNRKEGPATARVRFAGQNWDLTLYDPGTKVGLELYARQTPEVGRTLNGQGEPLVNVVLLVVKGEALVETRNKGFGMKAPPGTALALWDNLTGAPHLLRLEKLPDYAQPLNEREKKVMAEVDTCIKCLSQEPIDKVLDRLLGADNKLDRAVGVTLLGALDRLPRLLDVLATSTSHETREHAILTLRHWLGRGKDHCHQLRQVLIKDRKLTPIQARNVNQLLLGFTQEDLAEPVTYQVLISFLNHKALPIRELAHWHLVRLVPEADKINYDATAAPEVRERAIARYRELVPEGKLPQIPAKKK